MKINIDPSLTNVENFCAGFSVIHCVIGEKEVNNE
jgi:hypothetical protein